MWHNVAFFFFCSVTKNDVKSHNNKKKMLEKKRLVYPEGHTEGIIPNTLKVFHKIPEYSLKQ